MWPFPSIVDHGLMRSLAVILFAVSAAGCSDQSGVGKTVPVSGKVTFDNEPLTAESTTILFQPDTSKGNTNTFQPAGTVDEDGNYTVSTKGKAGAPPGWYKVIVTAIADRPEHPRLPGKKTNRPVAQSLLPAKYGQAKSSDLAIEVVEHPAPGAYDLKLSRK